MSPIWLLVLALAYCLLQFYKLRKLDKTVSENILAMLDNGEMELVPKEDGKVTLPHIEKKDNGDKVVTTKVWPIKSFNIIHYKYPIGGGLSFFKRDIGAVWLSAETWEPVSNLSPNREVVASPLFLGNLINEGITGTIVSMGKEVMDAIKSIGNMLNPTHFYIAVILNLAAIGVVIYLIMPLMNTATDLADMQMKIDAIMKALGLE